MLVHTYQCVNPSCKYQVKKGGVKQASIKPCPLCGSNQMRYVKSEKE